LRRKGPIAGWSGQRLGHRHRMALHRPRSVSTTRSRPSVEPAPLRGVARTDVPRSASSTTCTG
jgi:hypothetical protein